MSSRSEPADNVVALPAVPGNAADAPTDNTVRKQRAPKLTVRANVTGPEGLDCVKLDQEPGALLAVLGDQSGDDAKVGETRECGPYALTIINDLLQIAFAGEKLKAGEPMPPRVNAMLQQMAAFNPTDELEGMIALQAVSLHRASMESLRRGMTSQRADHRAQYIGQANKCSRTFAALLEQLNRHRGKVTTQRVVVENVNIAAGGQAVVGTIATAGGAGREDLGAIQPDGQTQERHGGSTRRASMFGPRPQWESLSAACEQGPDALSHAWRGGGERSAEGQPQCFEARAQHTRGDGDAQTGADAAERGGEPARVKPVDCKENR